MAKKFLNRPCWWEDCSWQDTDSDEEFLRRCSGKNLKQIQRALQYRGIFILDSPDAPLLRSVTLSISLPDNIRAVCCFHPLLKTCVRNREQQQQAVRLSALLFQKVAQEAYDDWLVRAQNRRWTCSATITDLDTNYKKGKLFFQNALTKYHVALHTFLEQALLCYDTAFRILKDDLEIKAQETSWKKVYNRLLQSTTQFHSSHEAPEARRPWRQRKRNSGSVLAGTVLASLQWKKSQAIRKTFATSRNIHP